MNSGPSIVALSENANIYMVVDERGRTIGTGTKEVCEVLAALTMKPAIRHSLDSRRSIPPPSRDNIRSAIKIF
jgi:hypothetical protein